MNSALEQLVTTLLYEGYALYPYMTVAENIALPASLGFSSMIQSRSSSSLMTWKLIA